MTLVLGVFARPNHPEGYGQCHGETNNYGQHVNAKAHGYIVVVVQCADWDELDAVKERLMRYDYGEFDPSTGRKLLPGFDPWRRGDYWYAGPYELVFSTEINDVLEVRGMNFYGVPLTLGDRPSYGDNRAMAYLDASEVLGG